MDMVELEERRGRRSGRRGAVEMAGALHPAIASRCAFATLFLVAVSISTRCRHRRAAGGPPAPFPPNIEWSFCGFARGGARMGGGAIRTSVANLRKWVCAACRGPAAAWSAFPRKIA